MTEENLAGPEPVDQKRRPGRWLWSLSTVNFVGLVVYGILIFVVSEDWWPGVIVTYAPRAWCVIPALILATVGLKYSLRAAGFNLCLVLVCLLVVLEFEVPAIGSGEAPSGRTLRVISCNVNKYGPDFDSVMEEIDGLGPDLIVFQEVPREGPRTLAGGYEDWHFLSAGEFLVGSRYPVKSLQECKTREFKRLSAVAVEIEVFGSKAVLVNVHPVTARWGFKSLGSFSWIPGDGVEAVQLHRIRRASELQEITDFVDRLSTGRPLIMAGDFNSPSSSKLYRDYWSDLTNTFEAAGWGYGYTAPCDGAGLLPSGWPWIRVDHILVNEQWQVNDSGVGSADGSDHRLVWADIALQPGKAGESEPPPE